MIDLRRFISIVDDRLHNIISNFSFFFFQVQSVIQPNQQSVIQTAANLQPMLGKGNVILVSKPNSVIQTTQGSLSGLQTLQVKVSFDGEMTKLF